MRSVIFNCLTVAAGMLLGASCGAAAERPNFLLIVADDACWRDFGFAGSKQVHTPRLDQLAQEGMHLTHMFTPATTCSPSRNALYSGLYCVRAGAWPNHTRLYDGTKSLFTHLKEHGYRTALQGKSHVGPPASYPYEQVGQNADDFAATEKFITRDKAEPWLLVFASNDPHGPWTRGPKNRYKPEELTVPSYLHDNAVTREQLAAYYAELTKLDNQVGSLLDLLDQTQQSESTLVMFVSEQGSSFPYGGKWSVYDNGIRVSSIVRWPGKVAAGSKSDALVQYVDVTPTFLEAAGIDPASIDVGRPDVNGERGFDGRSFLGVLRGKSNEHREYVFAQHTTVGINGYKEPYPMRAVRDDRYKLIRNLAPENTYSIGGIHKGQPIESWQEDAKSDPELARKVEWLFHRPGEELYDLESDPLETRNLAQEPQYAEIKARLQQRLDGWMEQQGDKGLQTELEAPSRQNAKRQERGADKPAPRKKARSR